MRHGIDAYYEELQRFERRRALLTLAVALAFLGLLAIGRRPEIVAALDRTKRFGFEGRDEYVRRILLEMKGAQDSPGANQLSAAPVNLHHGGGNLKTVTGTHGFKPVDQHPKGPTMGDDAVDLQSRLRALALDAPVVRSEDLVVERLVRPEYPEEAHAQDIEGDVELVALVDTTGEVREVHIVGGNRIPSLERAATDAVLQCRYRPYALNGTKDRVWAFYRIAFHLY
jgi:TonB family protein